MEVASSTCCEITEGGAKNISSHSECITRQPKANGPVVTAVNSALSHAPVCAPPTHQSSSLSTHNGNFGQHHHHQPGTYNQKQVSSIQNPTYAKADAIHIKEAAGEDYCFRCLLACLYCQLLSTCSVLGECLVCGTVGAGCCDTMTSCCNCCLEAAGEMTCTEEACQPVLDCEILGECCCPSDCLEICVECCSICFPA
ncbi:myoD family inhibitor isoform X2 [Cynoglossus semilaevis]|uniref:myoD family inhibitor isoform X2 n=1 Tax=Cynoglossus semilaevis TaxID=244447 RepID=UPI000D6230E4|nr:myoD family inhibitor-like isoform X2 [Cynoglossus semilaevis]